MTKATYTTTRTQQVGKGTNKAVESRETAHADRWGRLIGGIMETWEVDYELVPGNPAPSTSPWHPVPGHYFAASPHSMRKGERYGASQGTTLFTTAESRAAYVEKYFRDMEKRARKTAEADAAKVAAKGTR